MSQKKTKIWCFEDNQEHILEYKDEFNGIAEITFSEQLSFDVDEMSPVIDQIDAYNPDFIIVDLKLDEQPGKELEGLRVLGELREKTSYALIAISVLFRKNHDFEDAVKPQKAEEMAVRFGANVCLPKFEGGRDGSVPSAQIILDAFNSI